MDGSYGNKPCVLWDTKKRNKVKHSTQQDECVPTIGELWEYVDWVSAEVVAMMATEVLPTRLQLAGRRDLDYVSVLLTIDVIEWSI